MTKEMRIQPKKGLNCKRREDVELAKSDIVLELSKISDWSDCQRVLA